MKDVEILTQIQLTLDEINALFDQIKTHPAEAKSIEIDLLKYKIVQLYEHAQKLVHLLDENSKAQEVAMLINDDKGEEIENKDESIEKTQIKEEIIEEVIEQKEEIKQIEDIVEDEKEKEKEEEIKEEIVEEIKEQIPEIVIEKKELQQEFNPDIFEEAQEQIKKKAVHEKFARTEPSINEKMASSKGSGSVGDSLQKGPITDIKSAISLNLKLSLIKDLYQGDQKEYKKMIDFLSKCKNYSEAKMYVVNEKENRNHWANKTDLVETLMDLITRRFRMD